MPESLPIMACGDVAQGVDDNNNPVCIIHAGFTPDAKVVAEQPDLEGRLAYCTYDRAKRGKCPDQSARKGSVRCEFGCGTGEGAPSKATMPFFRHQPDQPFDQFYCGCWGWD